jgi:hypothetical protein
MILVITHTADRTEYDSSGRIVEEAGQVSVSHGIDTRSGKTIILPIERWENFRHNCFMFGGEWYLK